MRWSPILGRLLVLSTGLAAFSSSSALAAEPFKFLTNWYAQSEQGGFYQAQATDLYKNAGLDVTIQMGGPQINGMQLLLGGEADAIMGYDFQLLEAVRKGIPAVAVAATFQYDFQGVMTHDDVKSLGDLKDKTILVSTAGQTTWWPLLQKKFGYSMDQVKPYTFNLQPFFADPNVATSAYPSSEPFQAQQKGVPAKFFLLADEGYPPYGQIIVTTRSAIEKKPQALRSFIRASMQGWRDYMINPAPGNKLIHADNPDMSEEQIAFGIARINALNVLDSGGKVGIGSMTDERWKATADYMVATGMLPNTDGFAKAYTRELLPSPAIARN
jgi:NitT/TauT family transport system substrate-binding protein